MGGLGRVVLGHLDAQAAKLPEEIVRHGSLRPGGAGDPAEPDEAV
jgi:hypothetical protein